MSTNLSQLFESATKASVSVSHSAKSVQSDATIIPIIYDTKDKGSWLRALSAVKAPWLPTALKRVEALKFNPKKRAVMAFDHEGAHRVVLAFWGTGSTFEALGWARSCISGISGSKANSILLELSNQDLSSDIWLDALISAFTVAQYRQPRYGKLRKVRKPKELILSVGKPSEGLAQKILKRAFLSAQATNGLRYLSEMAGNDLTPSALKALALSLGKEPHMKVTFLSKKDLEKLSAGAFLAVVRGTEEPGVGIARISYRPKKSGTDKIALVGKGVTFDTGGNNLKTEGHMLGMNGDMGGSATVLSLLWLAQKSEWNIPIEGYVTIAENVIGPTAYRPNDVVVASNGKSIEVIDTDAEGRMLLADALAMAAKDKPALIMDFATLTGACVRAIGTLYSGVFSNKRQMFSALVRAGKESGERVWPFPNDADYGDCLKSRIADIKQCRPSGGSDHIEAAHFLSQFVGKVPWVHVDLSAMENEGGLAHVPGKLTGFGVRFSRRFLESFFKQTL